VIRPAAADGPVDVDEVAVARAHRRRQLADAATVYPDLHGVVPAIPRGAE
jgi:hypothetical protein